MSGFVTLHFHTAWWSSGCPPLFCWLACWYQTQRSWWHRAVLRHSYTTAFVFLHCTQTRPVEKPRKALPAELNFHVGLYKELRQYSTCNSGDFWLRSVKVSPRACCVCTMLWKCMVSAVASLNMFSYLILVSLNTSIWASNSRSTVREPRPNLSENICFVHCRVDINRDDIKPSITKIWWS